MGKPVSNSWGDGGSWAGAASSQGLSVNNTPSTGAIIQSTPFTNGSLGQGHVGVVEKVNGDGSVLVSEMNWNGGVGQKSMRTVSASQVSNHNFIH
jgi:surface antigen